MSGLGGVPESLGKIAFEAGEELTPKIADLAVKGAQKLLPASVAPSVSRGIAEATTWGIKAATNLYPLEDQLTGKYGNQINMDRKLYEQRRDFHKGNLVQNPSQYNLSPQQTQNFNQTDYHKLAHNAASSEVFGPNMEVLAGKLDAMRREYNQKWPGYGELKVRNIADAMGIYFHEQVQKEGGKGVLSPAGSVAYNLTQHPATEDIKFRPSEYKAPQSGERKTNLLASATYATLAGVEHYLTTPLNGLLGQSLSSFAKALPVLINPHYAENVKNAIYMLGGLGEFQAREETAMMEFKNGFISKFAPGTVGEFLHKNFPIPVMDMASLRNAIFFAEQGRWRAMEIRDDLLSGDARRVRNGMHDAVYNGMNPNAIIKRGTLDIDDLRQAMHTNVNDRMFTNMGARRSPISQRSFIYRLGTMFHGYRTGMSRLVGKTLLNHIRKQDPQSALKDWLVLALLFPTMGNLMDMGKHIFHGYNWRDELDEFEEKEKTRLGLNGFDLGKMFLANLDGLSNFATLGIFSSYSRTLTKTMYMGTLLGPIVGARIEEAHDLWQWIANNKDAQKGPYQAKTSDAIWRDIIHATPYLPNAIGRAMFPTQQQLNKEKPQTTKSIKAKQAVQRGKLKKGK